MVWVHSFYIIDQYDTVGSRRLSIPFDVTNEVYMWLEDNMKNRWRFLRHLCTISFENYEDAMAFKLRWL